MTKYNDRTRTDIAKARTLNRRRDRNAKRFSAKLFLAVAFGDLAL